MPARNAAMARVNEIRAMVGIPPVVYDATHDNQVQQAALVMAANASLSHTPPKNWWCWTQAAYDGASTSNLHLGMNTDGSLASPAAVVDALAIDMNVESLGHRRWILDPFLTRTSYGFVHGKPKVNVGWPYSYSGVLRVIDNLYANLSGLALDYIAYPVGKFPASLLPNGWYLSFSVLMDKSSPWNNQSVNYSGVSVKVTGPGGSNMPVSSVKYANDGMGIPNHLQWKCPGLKVGTQYTVTIGNVKFKGTSHQFQYTFILQ
ncbi:MAG: CAP domain-containing protein [Deltaproteobacteria bacterium]|nr:CAP domain-containing protein [Deltaproteobacteria bacterium]